MMMLLVTCGREETRFWSIAFLTTVQIDHLTFLGEIILKRHHKIRRAQRLIKPVPPAFNKVTSIDVLLDVLSQWDNNADIFISVMQISGLFRDLKNNCASSFRFYLEHSGNVNISKDDSVNSLATFIDGY